MEKVDLAFTLEKIKLALETPSVVTGDPEKDQNFVLVPIHLRRFGKTNLAFCRQKVQTAYRSALEAGRNVVVIEFEGPSDADWQAKSFKRDSDFLVPDPSRRASRKRGKKGNLGFLLVNPRKK